MAGVHKSQKECFRMGKAGVKIILGIDPGTNTTGYGVIEVRGSVVLCVILGVIDLHQLKDPYRK